MPPNSTANQDLCSNGLSETLMASKEFKELPAVEEIEKSKRTPGLMLLGKSNNSTNDPLVLEVAYGTTSNSKDVEVVTDSTEIKKYIKQEIIWHNVIVLTIFHLLFVYSMLNLHTMLYTSHLQSIVWALGVGLVGGVGVTGGAHRLWTHRTYKAKLPLRILLVCCFSMSGQNTMYDWVRDHRVHHKFSETDADPHNAKRGFFFSHVGWLLMRKHPEVKRRGQLVDMSDVLDDPVIQFHQKYFIPMQLLLCFAIPILVPVIFWGESWYNAIFGIGCFRYVLNLNFTWLVNSAAHMFGNKPYDRRIGPTENRVVAFFAMGEGWHNYHHVFPWDYKAAELGNYSLNTTTFCIDLFSKIGWAYDLKTASPKLIQTVTDRYGDGSHSYWGHEEIPEETNGNVEVLNKQE